MDSKVQISGPVIPAVGQICMKEVNGILPLTQDWLRGIRMNRKGRLFESALIGELIQQGFKIQKSDAELDHAAKLDFVIHRFPGSIMHHQFVYSLPSVNITMLRRCRSFMPSIPAVIRRVYSDACTCRLMKILIY
jgi:hypothetical protein